MTQEEFEKYAREHDIFFCTSDMIEQMREEIAVNGNSDINTRTVLAIIDKYTNGGKT